MGDIVGASKGTPPSDPLAQAREVAVGLIIETPAEQPEHMMDAGSISGIGGGIAGEGIVGGETEDIGDTREVHDEGMNEERTSEEKLGKETKDLDSEMVKDDVQESSHQEG